LFHSSKLDLTKCYRHMHLTAAYNDEKLCYWGHSSHRGIFSDQHSS
jgi:hypothetical protein